ncbi:MAG: flagellar hook-associated protein 3 [Acidimicrobiaceae bacterium]|nr:flagellar hook-associated protein 3 [Acidimicrobiaceae bacterium]
MRVADLSLTDTLSGNLNAQEANITQLDAELSSGNALSKPSDNPVAVVDTLGYERQLSQVSSVQSSASTASSWLGVANNAANSVLNNLSSVRTVVLQALNSGAQNSATYTSMSEQLKGQMQSLIGIANTTYAGTSIFGGTSGATPAYTATGAYQGNETPFTIALSNGQKVDASVPGTQLFGGGTTGVQSVFTTLQNLVNDLSSGPSATAQASLQTDLNSLDANVTQAQAAAASLGVSSQQVSTVQGTASTASQQIQSVLASTEYIDVASVTTQLQQDMTSYQAALYVTSKTVPESLASYL